jgi:RNA polymerase sigma factor (sigma-70 family)
MNYKEIYKADKELAERVYEQMVDNMQAFKELMIDFAIDYVHAYRKANDFWELYENLKPQGDHGKLYFKNMVKNAFLKYLRDYDEKHDTTDNDDNEMSLLDTIAGSHSLEPENELAYHELIQSIKDIVKDYPEKYKKVIRMYLNHRSYKEIARFFGISFQRVGQIISAFRIAVSKRIEPTD